MTEDKAAPTSKTTTHREPSKLSTALAVGAATGGRRHGVPGLLVFGLVGLGGQAILNRIPTDKGTQTPDSDPNVEKEGSIISRLLASPNSPIRKLSREEYMEKMKEKQLALDAEIALIDEEIERLRQNRDSDHSQSPPRK
ncbi:hypothetical protein TWF696_009869 [Orbilia brochopaga]|uniref:Uncharacterized protein n=1 Tax=Orbilia brochopaga TaxID=3140254 RepID=A0AAV9UFM2_9PEZI